MSEETSVPKTPWQVDSTHPQEGEKIRTALRQVKDPEIGFSIIERGLVRETQIEDSKLHLKMILTTPYCPYGPMLLEMARSKAAEASGLETTIELSLEMWTTDMMEESTGASWGLF